MKTLIIIGGSGHGKVCADIAELMGYKEILFLDNDESLQECGGHRVVGHGDDISSFGQDAEYFVAIGNAETRAKVTARILEQGGRLATLVHPSAVVAGITRLGEGSAVMAGAVINPGAVLGRGCIVNTAASVDHDCNIGDFVHVAVGAHLCGTVSVGEGTWIGAGATVSNNVSICEGVMLGAGAVVVRDITEPGTYVGVPARKI